MKTNKLGKKNHRFFEKDHKFANKVHISFQRGNTLGGNKKYSA